MTVKIWWFRVREHMNKIILALVLGGLGFYGYHLYKQGTFSQGLGPAVSQVLQKIPFFGSRFRTVMIPSEQSDQSFYSPAVPAPSHKDELTSNHNSSKSKARTTKKHRNGKNRRRR